MIDNTFELFTTPELEAHASLLAALAHPVRLRIVCGLLDGDCCVGPMVECLELPQAFVSRHLAILRDKGILATRKDANRVYYRVGDIRTLQLISMMRQVFCQQGH